MSLDPEIQHPTGPIGAATTSTPQITCPSCHSQQFYGERRMSGTGKILFWTGLVATVISLLLMFVWLGMCTIWPSIILLAIAPLFRQYVNVCANCKTKF